MQISDPPDDIDEPVVTYETEPDCIDGPHYVRQGEPVNCVWLMQCIVDEFGTGGLAFLLKKLYPNISGNVVVRTEEGREYRIIV